MKNELKIGNLFLTFGSGLAQAEYSCACGFATREPEEFVEHVRTHVPNIAKRLIAVANEDCPQE